MSVGLHDRIDLLHRAYGTQARSVAQARAQSLRAAGFGDLAAEWAEIAALIEPPHDQDAGGWAAG